MISSLLKVSGILLLGFQVLAKEFRPDFPVFSGIDSSMDMWEPMLAEDPSTGDIYIFATNNYGVRGCVDCGIDPILFRRTSNNGKSWKTINNFAWEYLDYGEDTDETADAVVVIDNVGVLYATYMTGWNISFSKSTDQGRTWSDRQLISGELQADKNWISIDPVNQNKLYATFNSRLPYEVHSTDGGDTWSEHQLLDDIDGVYFFGCGSVVRSDGAAFIAYGATNEGDGGSNYSYAMVYGSTDGFATVTPYQIDYWTGLQSCPEWAGCEPDFLNGACSLGVDKDDNVYYIYNAYPDHGADESRQGIFLAYLTPTATAFTAPILVSDIPTSTSGIIYLGFPMVAGGLESGDVRVTWMDNRTGMWNIWYRSSENFFDPSQGGGNEEPSIRLSTYDQLSFQNSDGFEFPYGDYGMMIVDKKGYTHVVWGEGLGWYAGGTVMYATQAPAGSDDDDNDSDGLSQTSIIIMSVVFSFVGGAVIAALVTWMFMSKRSKDSLLK